MTEFFNFDWVNNPAAWMGLLTLAILEIVLGIDNIVFISILASKLKTPEEQDKARKLGLTIALVSRLILVASAAWIVQLKYPIFTLPFDQFVTGTPEHKAEVLGISWRDVILLLGGLFLIWKATKEIHHKLEGQEESHGSAVAPALGAILVQILILDVVFSVDSVITAVGMVDYVSIMMIAVIIAVIFMLVYSKPISRFVHDHPTVKMLALAFLILIGVSLLAEAFETPIPKGYIYFAMAFSVLVEMLNLKLRSGKPLVLKDSTLPEDMPAPDKPAAA